MSFSREAELHGARLLLIMHDHLRDPDSQIKLNEIQNFAELSFRRGAKRSLAREALQQEYKSSANKKRLASMRTNRVHRRCCGAISDSAAPGRAL
jgi:hypothetical protein